MKKEDIQALKKEVETDVKELGLTKAIATMVTRAARKHGGIYEALEAFRKSVKTTGGMNIDKDIAWLALLYGNLKEKSLAIFLGCWEGKIISKDEAYKMRDFLTTLLDEEGHERHMKYFQCFRTMKNHMDYFTKLCYIYKTSAYSLSRDIAIYDSITVPNKYFAELINLLPYDESTMQKSYDILVRYAEEMRKNTIFGHFQVVEENGNIAFKDISKDALLDDILEMAKQTNKALQYYKSVYVGYLEWAKEHGAEDFMPVEFRDEEEKIRHTDGIVTISPIWRKSVLEKKKANGEEVTEEEEKKGVLLSFSEVEPIAKAVEVTKMKLDYFYDNDN